MTISQTNRKYALAIGLLVLTALCAAMFSFSVRPGGDSFTISVNQKVLLHQYVFKDEGVKTISFADVTANDQVSIKYSHCGKIGHNRSVAIKDSQNKALKVWQFPDVKEGSAAEMSFKAKELFALYKTSKGKLNLVYSSRELSDEKILASIATPTEPRASLK